MWISRPACLRIARDDLGVAVAGGRDGDPGGEVEEPVAVDVLDHRHLRPTDHQRIGPGVRRGHHRVVAVQPGLGPGAGQGAEDAGLGAMEGDHGQILPWRVIGGVAVAGPARSRTRRSVPTSDSRIENPPINDPRPGSLIPRRPPATPRTGNRSRRPAADPPPPTRPAPSRGASDGTRSREPSPSERAAPDFAGPGGVTSPGSPGARSAGRRRRGELRGRRRRPGRST